MRRLRRELIPAAVLSAGLGALSAALLVHPSPLAASFSTAPAPASIPSRPSHRPSAALDSIPEVALTIAAAPQGAAQEPIAALTSASTPEATPDPAPAAGPAPVASPQPVKRPRWRAEPPLHTARGWLSFLRAAERDLEPLSEREVDARLREDLRRAEDPVVRQNLIFLAALTLPRELARPFLADVVRGGDPDDQADAVTAQAFGGDRAALAAFASLPPVPAPRRLIDGYDDHEALAGLPGARDLLRSYRAIEVLDREPYFDMTAHLVRLSWTPHPLGGDPRVRDLHYLALLPEWLERFPAHPGSDDMAVRVARVYERWQDPFRAARWYRRATTLPDQDMTHAALYGLVATCELHLDVRGIERLLADGWDRERNRELLSYVRLRRIAAGEGFAAATAACRDLAMREPDGLLARAWVARGAERAPRGLDSGLEPLPEADPLRARWGERFQAELDVLEAARPRPERIGRLYSPWLCAQQGEGRLEPWHESLDLDGRALARQMRTWETLAELESRAFRAVGDARADLLYKQAAVFYHQPDALFPVYGAHTVNFEVLLDWFVPTENDIHREARAQAQRQRFEDQTYSLLRAADLFARIEAEHPTYRGLDRVLFSRGMAWKKLHGQRPGLSPRQDPEQTPRAVGELLAAFEGCARRFPWSPLADDAQRAASYWRRSFPDVDQR